MTDLVEWPGNLPDHVTDEVLREACRSYLSGARVDVLGAMLGIPPKKFSRLTLTPKWQALMVEVRDEFVNAAVAQSTRIETGILDRIEDMLERGVEGYTATGEHYTRKLSPKECASLWTAVQGFRKQVDKMRGEAPNRRTFNQADQIARFERFTKATEVDAQVVQ